METLSEWYVVIYLYDISQYLIFLLFFDTGYTLPPPTLPNGDGLPSTPVSAGDQEIKPLLSNGHQPNMLADLSRVNLSSSQKKEGRCWYAVFNPEVQRVLDIELVHHLALDSVACCVSFSPDGKYLATGCNRSVSIFDVKTGENVITLRDDSLSQHHDIYIRSVSFSPDGKYLATGSEDKIVTVRPKTNCLIITPVLCNTACYIWFQGLAGLF